MQNLILAIFSHFEKAPFLNRWSGCEQKMKKEEKKNGDKFEEMNLRTPVEPYRLTQIVYWQKIIFIKSF